MVLEAKGLTPLTNEELKKLLSFVFQGEVACPLEVVDLARAGLQHRYEPILAALRGLDQAAVKAVLICVIAERTSRG